MEAKAVARYVRVSPRKARLLVDLIRGKSIADAQAILKFSPRAAAEVVEKVLNSAVANAERNLHVKADDLFVGSTFVDEGPTLKRIQPRAMGRAFRINKRTSHITVIVKQREGA
jgi:large subunit ribosomal protein L22